MGEGRESDRHMCSKSSGYVYCGGREQALEWIAPPPATGKDHHPTVGIFPSVGHAFMVGRRSDLGELARNAFHAQASA